MAAKPWRASNAHCDSRLSVFIGPNGVVSVDGIAARHAIICKISPLAREAGQIGFRIRPQQRGLKIVLADQADGRRLGWHLPG